MKIVVSAAGQTLDAEVDPRFGRCQFFVIADPETMDFEVMDNSSTTAAGGAGISAAQVIADKDVQAVMTGNCGPNAYQVLSSAGIQIITGVSGTIKDALEGYRSGKYRASVQANVPDHFGMGGMSGMRSGSGIGRGMGMGRGSGRGMGGGMGRGMGFNMPPPAAPMQPLQNPEEEVQALRAQSQAMAQQLAEIQNRIEELEKKRG